jgi:hypothetical protein
MLERDSCRVAPVNSDPIPLLFYRLSSIRIRRENRWAEQATVVPSFFLFHVCRRTAATTVGAGRQMSGFRDRWR